jgi:hypothetical protein
MYEDSGIPFFPITKPSAVPLESDERYAIEMAARGGRDPLE